MSEQLRPVRIGEIVASADPAEALVVYGLGSCVVICLYDPVRRAGGMLHALLPGPTGYSWRGIDKPGKFISLGLPLLLETMAGLGARPGRLAVRLCGGAQVLTTDSFDGWVHIGRRNIAAAEEALALAGLEITARATGGTAGRTIKFRIADGQVTVRTLGEAERVL